MINLLNHWSDRLYKYSSFYPDIHSFFKETQLVGFAVGLTEGSLVGSAVGFPDGLAVGL